jgi:superfamily II DNA/RNA helicase
VATDSVARGFDVQQAGTVFPFGVARDHVSYVHRSSLCGQRGRRGVAVSIVAGDDEWRWLQRIEDAAIRSLPEHALDSARVNGVPPEHGQVGQTTHTRARAHTRIPELYV